VADQRRQRLLQQLLLLPHLPRRPPSSDLPLIVDDGYDCCDVDDEDDDYDADCVDDDARFGNGEEDDEDEEANDCGDNFACYV
jgi:hypothetical protein